MVCKPPFWTVLVSWYRLSRCKSLKYYNRNILYQASLSVNKAI